MGPAKKKSISLRYLSRLIGRLTATMQTVLTAPLHYRNFQELTSQTILGIQYSCDSGSECKRGVDLVAGKPPELEWESSAKTKTRYSGGDGSIPPRIGGSCGRNKNRRPLIQRRTITSYQPAGVDSRRVRSQDLCSPQKKHSHALQNGQQDSHILHEQDAWEEIDHISLPTQLASFGSGASSGGLHCQQNICRGPAIL